MKVTIDKVTLIGDEVLVEFSTDFGSAIAAWSAVPPMEGDVHDVELDVAERIVWGVSAQYASKTAYSIGVGVDSIKLTGILIRTHTDGTTAVDVGGSVILLEMAGLPSDAPVFIDIIAKKISLFPTGI